MHTLLLGLIGLTLLVIIAALAAVYMTIRRRRQAMACDDTAGVAPDAAEQVEDVLDRDGFSTIAEHAGVFGRRRCTWTPQEARTLATLGAQGVSHGAIATMLRRTPRACQEMLHDLVHGCRPDLCIHRSTRIALETLRARTGVDRADVLAAMRTYWQAHIDDVPAHAMPVLIDRLAADLAEA